VAASTSRPVSSGPTDEGLHAFDGESGRALWECQAYGGTNPVALSATAVFDSVSCIKTALDRRSGRQLSINGATCGGIAELPVYHDGRLYIADDGPAGVRTVDGSGVTRA
jgi:hypothetical protein